MKCPLCHQEMQPGGLVVDGGRPGWVPLAEFEKKGLHRLLYRVVHWIGKTNYLLRQTKIANAYYCASCNKIVGFFDVTDN